LRLIALRSEICSEPKLPMISIAQLFHHYLFWP